MLMHALLVLLLRTDSDYILSMEQNNSAPYLFIGVRMDNNLLPDEKITVVNDNIKLIEKKQGLTFGTDAYLLSAFIKPQKSGIAVELGGGTGIISMLCSSRGKFSKIYCAELQETFCDIIKRNIMINGLDNIFCLDGDIRDLNVQKIGKEADVVFSNPPYMCSNCGKRNFSDEKYIARHEIFGGINDFCECACRLLKHGGLFYCVFRPDRLADLFFFLRINRLEPKEMTMVYSNTKSKPSIVLVKAKKGASPSLIVNEPLFLNRVDDPLSLTERAKTIYENCNF